MSIAEKLTTIAENEQKVFDSGKQAEYDKFWDGYQENGNRTDYQYAFTGKYWNNETFTPKYDIVSSDYTQRLFFNTGEIDVCARLKECGVTLDISQSTGITYIAYNSNILNLPILDCRNFPSLTYFITENRMLKSVEKVILKDDGSQAFGVNTSFSGLYALEEIRFEGVIGQNNFNIKNSTLLSKASIESIINALSTVTSGLTVTLSKTAVNNAFETAQGLADGSTSEEWLNLVATKTNWTISLV